jgi:hypothetical protein
VAGAGVPSFDPDDADGCASAIRAALSRPREDLERDRLRADGFTWDRAAEAWVAGWVEAAGRGG